MAARSTPSSIQKACSSCWLAAARPAAQSATSETKTMSATLRAKAHETAYRSIERTWSERREGEILARPDQEEVP